MTSDEKVAYAAASSLSKIANKDAIEALSAIISKPSSPLYVKAGQCLIDIAQAKASDNTQEAGNIFNNIFENTADSPETTSIRIAAINGIIECNPEKASTEIVKFIKDENPKIRSTAVMGARMASSDAPAKALSAILSDLKPDTQIQVLGLIGDRKDISAINQVKNTLNSNEESVRLASIETMSKLGDTESAKLLFDKAVNGMGTEKQAAHQGLVQMDGTNVEVLINANSRTGETPSRVEAIRIIGQRGMKEASENLLAIATEDNEQTSAAAFEALSNIADTSSIPTLVELISQAKSERARRSGIATLKAILTKAEDKDATAQIVIDQMNKSNSEVKTALLTSLNSLGGSKALAAVIEATKSSDETTKDSAIRTLCDWPDYEATKTLFEIASNSETSLAHHVLSIRAIARLIESANFVSLEERVALALSTYDIARRTEEKGQIIATMGTLADTQIVDKLLGIAKGETLKTEAALALIQLAGNMQRSDRQASQELAQQILDMNISEQVNTQAQAVLSGRNRGRGNFGGNRGAGNTRGGNRAGGTRTGAAGTQRRGQ